MLSIRLYRTHSIYDFFKLRPVKNESVSTDARVQCHVLRNDFRLIKCELVNLFVTVCLSRCSPSELVHFCLSSCSLGVGPSSLPGRGRWGCLQISGLSSCLELHFCSLISVLEEWWCCCFFFCCCCCCCSGGMLCVLSQVLCSKAGDNLWPPKSMCGSGGVGQDQKWGLGLA